MNKLKISHKLIVAFGAMLVLNICIGLFAVQRMNDLNQVSTNIETNWMPSIKTVNEVNTDILTMRILQLAHILSTNEADMRQYEGEMAKMGPKRAEAIKRYKTLISSPEEQRIWDKTFDTALVYKGIWEKAIGFSKNNQNDEARELILGEGTKVNRELRNGLQTLVKLNLDSAVEESKQGDIEYADSRNLVFAAVGLATVLTILFAYSLTKGISLPISNMTNAMAKLANKEKETEVPGVGRHDEIGEMAGAVQVFKDNMIKADQLAAEQEAQQAKDMERAKRIEERARRFDADVTAAIEIVATAAGEMQSKSNTLSSSAEIAIAQSSEVASASTQAAGNVQTVASAAEQLSASITQIVSDTTESSKAMAEAVEEASRTQNIVNEMQQASDKIGEVIDLISDIAEQTNLLALNATIEAARAGEMGKGFAVVASEVKNLANQTARATEDISGQITSARSITEQAVMAIASIAASIEKVSEINSSISAAMEEQQASTAEIARNVEDVAQGTAGVSSNITSVTEAIQGAGHISQDVLLAAGNLTTEAEHMREIIAEFLRDVQAA